MIPCWTASRDVAPGLGIGGSTATLSKRLADGSRLLAWRVPVGRTKRRRAVRILALPPAGGRLCERTFTASVVGFGPWSTEGLLPVHLYNVRALRCPLSRRGRIEVVDRRIATTKRFSRRAIPNQSLWRGTTLLSEWIGARHSIWEHNTLTGHSNELEALVGGASVGVWLPPVTGGNLWLQLWVQNETWEIAFGTPGSSWGTAPISASIAALDGWRWLRPDVAVIFGFGGDRKRVTVTVDVSTSPPEISVSQAPPLEFPRSNASIDTLVHRGKVLAVDDSDEAALVEDRTTGEIALYEFSPTTDS
jgi:hypothetical protein